MDQPFQNRSRIAAKIVIEEYFAITDDRAHGRPEFVADVGDKLFLDAIRFNQSLIRRFGPVAGVYRLFIKPAVFQRKRQLIGQGSQQA